jgi:hypothetical protein
MANAFDALVLDVNQKLSEMDKAASNANGSAAVANEAAAQANKQAAAAQTAAAAAQAAAADASGKADAWNGVTVSATSLAEGETPTVVVKGDSAKEMLFGIPVGATGPQGPKGDPGVSGVSFQLSGDKLYITTD